MSNFSLSWSSTPFDMFMNVLMNSTVFPFSLDALPNAEKRKGKGNDAVGASKLSAVSQGLLKIWRDRRECAPETRNERETELVASLITNCPIIPSIHLALIVFFFASRFLQVMPTNLITQCTNEVFSDSWWLHFGLGVVFGYIIRVFSSLLSTAQAAVVVERQVGRAVAMERARRPVDGRRRTSSQTDLHRRTRG